MDNPLVSEQDVPEMGVGSGQSEIAEEVDKPEQDNGKRPVSDIDPKLVDPFGVHRRAAIFPGMDGLPFRGAPPDLKETDPEHKQPQIGQKIGIKQLNLADANDMEEYKKIAQLVANGLAQISFEERVYGEDIKSWRILIRWVEYYYFLPTVQSGSLRR